MYLPFSPGFPLHTCKSHILFMTHGLEVPVLRQVFELMLSPLKPKNFSHIQTGQGCVAL